jgi:hypothetical protein
MIQRKLRSLLDRSSMGSGDPEANGKPDALNTDFNVKNPGVLS